MRRCLSGLDLDDHHQAAAPFAFGIIVGRVVPDVAVNEPFAGIERRPDNIVALSWADIDGVGLKARCWREVDAVTGNDGERSTMRC